jgi:hypothetical protein
MLGWGDAEVATNETRVDLHLTVLHVEFNLLRELIYGGVSYH